MIDENEDVDIWKGDLLGRKDEAIYLQRYIENAFSMDKAHETSLVLNINSEWGSGKTWFLERFSKELKKNHPVIYFDAWANDFTKDALMSFVSTVCNDIERQFEQELNIKSSVSKLKETAYKFIKPSLPVLLSALVKHYVGLNVIQEDEASAIECEWNPESVSSIQDVASSFTSIAASAAIESFHEEKGSIENFRKTLGALIEYLKNEKSASYLPMCIFVDELDRCRPTYAIELLESIKHLFNIPGIFFVIASDTKQLSHSIKVVYGQNFNATAYLKRFFYSEYMLNVPEYKNMAEHLFLGFNYGSKLFLPSSFNSSLDGAPGLFSKVAEFFQLTVREQEQAFSVLKNCVLVTDTPELHATFIMFLVCLKLKHEDFYGALVANPQNNVYDKYIHKGIDEGYFTDVKMENYLYGGGHGKLDKSLSIFAVFRHYISILRVDIEGIRVNYNGSYYLYQEEIANKLLESTHVIPPGVRTTKHNLNSYFLLLNQAGRIIV
ncbi:MAG: P-loop NTPase fold protein [Cellvibrio sp.]|uniref:KAP family P-loop NTPase fold protein n=1 Tax=Cellvibrio sp. TaxID=1965322 RepID=UPI0031A6343F